MLLDNEPRDPEPRRMLSPKPDSSARATDNALDTYRAHLRPKEQGEANRRTRQYSIVLLTTRGSPRSS